jgi:hypothetical protein
MSLQTDVIPFRGWSGALRIGNGAVEAVVTLEVGPRILSFGPPGGDSPLAVFADQAGGRGEPQWRIRGGHRLWFAPEHPADSYVPDNAPVAWRRLGPDGVRLTPPPETATGFQKEIDLFLADGAAALTLVHRLVRIGPEARRAAPWALTVMAPGGFAIVPQPPLGEHPRDLLPNRRMVLWPYTDLSDPRYRIGPRYLTLRQDPGGKATKLGLENRLGWAGYLRDGTLFLKRFAWEAGAEYPDEGCNCELFTNGKMLEVESLGPLRVLRPGESAEWTERWELHTGLPPVDPGRPDELATALAARGI